MTLLVIGALIVLSGAALARRAARPRDPAADAVRERLEPFAGGLILDVRRSDAGWRVTYDVRDILTWPPDLPEPEISLRLAPAAPSSAGVLTFEDDSEDTGANLDSDKLVEIVEGTLGEDEPGRVWCSDGALVVSKSLLAQDKVARLLDALERTKRSGWFGR